MPPLTTKTIRIRQDQESTLSTPIYKDRVGFLFRDLLDIFFKAELPGAEIMRLRKKIKETQNGN